MWAAILSTALEHMNNCEIGVFRLDPPACSSINCIFFKSFIGPSSLKIANVVITGPQLRRMRYQLHGTATGEVGGSIMKLKLQLVLSVVGQCGSLNKNSTDTKCGVFLPKTVVILSLEVFLQRKNF